MFFLDLGNCKFWLIYYCMICYNISKNNVGNSKLVLGFCCLLLGFFFYIFEIVKDLFIAEIR